MNKADKIKYVALIEKLRELDIGTAANVFVNVVDSGVPEMALTYLYGVESMALHTNHPDAWKLHDLRQEIKWLLR